jgi:ubiquinone/menaquinone biosynthesis C-methylase UbiE
MSLPMGDKTPINFVIKKDNIKEQLKKIVRKFLYPPYLSIKSKSIEKRFSHVKNMGMNEIFLGQRGNDYDAHRRRINTFRAVKNSTVLIIGIGTGKDLESWLKYKPKKIIAIDYFDYTKAWKMRIKQYETKFNTQIEFLQADIIDLKTIENDSIDIVGSDAVFEHINQFSKAIIELKRVLNKGGILYSNFGPLWYSWGGDHISGSDDFINGYNHIRLDKNEYNKYLDSFGEFTHSEHDGRTWIKNNLFSYLKPQEYLAVLESQCLEKLYTSCIVDEKSLKYKKLHYDVYVDLVNKFEEKNLMVSGMTIIYSNN